MDHHDRPLILLTNDDGVYAPGLLRLYQSMHRLGRPVIVAPDEDKSAVSHALTMHRPLRVKEVEEGIYAVNGTPTDCITLGLNKVLAERPALVVSGINPGGNLGDDISYSGTVSAAVEATMLGVPALAVSLAGEEPFRFEVAAAVARRVAEAILVSGLPRDTLLNLNVPNRGLGDLRGVRFTRQGRRLYEGSIKETFDPWGRQHYWIGGGTPSWDRDEATDAGAVEAGFVSITPIHLDLTNYQALAALADSWQIDLG